MQRGDRGFPCLMLRFGEAITAARPPLPACAEVQPSLRKFCLWIERLTLSDGKLIDQCGEALGGGAAQVNAEHSH